MSPIVSDGIELHFLKELFNVNTDLPDPFNMGECAPVWNNNEQKWIWKPRTKKCIKVKMQNEGQKRYATEKKIKT